jgi:hypothetical protein
VEENAALTRMPEGHRVNSLIGLMCQTSTSRTMRYGCGGRMR